MIFSYQARIALSIYKIVTPLSQTSKPSKLSGEMELADSRRSNA